MKIPHWVLWAVPLVLTILGFSFYGLAQVIGGLF